MVEGEPVKETVSKTAYEIESKTGSEMVFGMLNETLTVTAINLNGK